MKPKPLQVEKAKREVDEVIAWRLGMDGMNHAIEGCDPMASAWEAKCGELITGREDDIAPGCPKCKAMTAKAETPTPRTDAMLQPYQPTPAFERPQWVSADFARILERELTQLRNAVFALCGHLPGVSQEEQLAMVKDQLTQWREVAAEMASALRNSYDVCEYPATPDCQQGQALAAYGALAKKDFSNSGDNAASTSH